MIRGMTSLNLRQRKKKTKTKSAALLAEEQKIAKLLKKYNYVKPTKNVGKLPNYSTSDSIPTSDFVGNGFKKVANQYTGNELAGIGTLHKSNMVPIRKDSNDAKEIARMRRG